MGRVESQGLNDALNKSPIDRNGLGDRIAFLRKCGVSEENLITIAGASQENRDYLLSVLGEKPSNIEIEVANNCLDLFRIKSENKIRETSENVRDIIMLAADDNLPRISRSYGGTGQKPANGDFQDLSDVA